MFSDLKTTFSSLNLKTLLYENYFDSFKTHVPCAFDNYAKSNSGQAGIISNWFKISQLIKFTDPRDHQF